MSYRTLLIDGDIFVYQIASECEKPAMDWGDDVWSPEVADLKEAQSRIDDRFARLATDLDADRIVIALKDADNWRKHLLPEYKAHRANVRPPLLRAALMEYVRTTYGDKVFSRPTLEGDDILGILATSTKIVKGEKVIVSIDKDMKSVPGLSYNPAKPDQGIVEVSEAEADYWHMRQTLTGDATDGYSGCPKVGPVKAAAILLNRNGSMWDAVLSAYKKAGLSPGYALLQARVARILRVTDYDFKKKEVILWCPPDDGSSTQSPPQS